MYQLQQAHVIHIKLLDIPLHVTKKYVLVTTGTCNTYPVTRFPVTCYKTNMYVTEPTLITITERVTSVPKYIYE